MVSVSLMRQVSHVSAKYLESDLQCLGCLLAARRKAGGWSSPRDGRPPAALLPTTWFCNVAVCEQECGHRSTGDWML